MKGEVKMYYYPNQWYQHPYVYRLEEKNEQEEQEWEIEKKFMNDMRKAMSQQSLIQMQILERIQHLDRRLYELERMLSMGHSTKNS